ncbi:MAG TPA: oligopeptide ABC transporter substrate-binding protein [Virgibacillus sp.]|nr:oligopeptide ABC transporter substrate-binding protein [Virgibacillus sp.]
MRIKYLNTYFISIMLVFLLALAACSKNSDDNNASGPDNDDDLFDISDFDQTKENMGDAIDGGTLNFGLVSDSPFAGTLNWAFYSGNPDAEILNWFDESLLDMNADYEYTQDGAATYEVSDDHRTFTFTIGDDVNWHDGEPVTAEDWAFSYEVIGHPDYDGPRYDSSFTNVEGMDEYHEGEADDISGIDVIDDKTLEITFKKGTPSLLNGGIWPYPLAEHIFGDMDVSEMGESDAVRKNPIGFGPFKVKDIVPGESVTFEKFDDYWRGEPKLDGVDLTVVNPETVVQSLEKGKVDMVDSFPADQYPNHADMSNVEYLGDIDMSYSYIGFKLGDWDKEKGEVVPDPDKKMADKELRQAMWHAVDNDQVGKKFYHGLRWNATTLIPPSHEQFHDEDNPGLEYDPEKAEELLDEAGYEDVDDDGFREDPDGNELVINFAFMEGDDVAEPMAKYYMQAWEEVGLKVELLDGRLQEFNTFYERVGETGDDDEEVDVYAGAWGVASDVDPRGLYGRDAIFNFPRYATDENDELLEEGVSEDSFDVDHREEVYNDWQELMVDEVPVFPTLYRSEIIPVNNRVLNYSIDDDEDLYRYEIELSEEEPITAEEAE